MVTNEHTEGSGTVLRAKVPQEKLNIDEKTRSSLFQWSGQFSPQLIEALIRKYAKPNAKLLDPFMGSGTVLHEAASMGLQCVGSDVNPAAFHIGRLYSICNSKPSERQALFVPLKECLDYIFGNESPLIGGDIESRPGHQRAINNLISTAETLGRNSCARFLTEGFITLGDKARYEKDPVQLLSLFEKLERTVMNFPYSKNPIQALNSDCRKLPIQDNSIDLIITSPPYINVLNYHQQYRKNTEALGWDVLNAAKSEFGSNRKHRGNRFLTVIQYCLDIAECFIELYRVSESSAHIIFIVGKESNVRGIPFYNGKLVKDIAAVVGLNLDLQQERTYMNRFGKNICEEILHFTAPSKPNIASSEKVKTIAVKALQEATSIAEGSVLADIENAICSVNNVEPSILYQKRI